MSNDKKHMEMMTEASKAKNATRATGSEVDQRISKIFHMLLKSTPRSEIMLLGEEWLISTRNMESLLSRARKRIKEILLKDDEEALGSLVHMAYKLYDDAVNNKEFEVARKLLADLVKMRGLEQANKQELTVTTKQASNTESATLLNIVKKAKKKASE